MVGPIKRLAQRTVKEALWLAGHLRPTSTAGTAFLIYHSVSGRLPIELDLPPALLERQLAYLADSGAVIAYDTALAQLATGKPSRRPTYVLTFDDGYLDFYTTVFPLLQRWQLPATLFVTTGFIEERVGYPMLSYPHLRVEPVTWAMLGEMAASGLVTLGAHTHTHPLLTTSSAAQVAEELVRPLELFQREVGITPHHFCYPQARWNPAVEQLVKKYYQTAVISEGRWARATAFDPFRIPRLPIRRSDGWRYFQAKVAGRMANEEALYAQLRRLAQR